MPSTPESQDDNRERGRRRCQFRLRTLLILICLTSLPFAWLAARMDEARAQRRAVEYFQQRDVKIEYDYQWDEEDQRVIDPEPWGPSWLRDLMGLDFVASATHLYARYRDPVEYYRHADLADRDLIYLQDLPQLEELDLSGMPVTDESMKHVGRLTKLRWCNLAVTKISDAGLAELVELDQLEFLDLRGTPIGDAGLIHLQQLPRLWELRLVSPNITAGGLHHLKEIPSLRELWVNSEQMTDAWLEVLAEMDKLTILYMRVRSSELTPPSQQNGTRPTNGAGVTEAGMEKLRLALSECDVRFQRLPALP